MSEKSQPTLPAKRGRKPLGERAMTVAERKRLSRTRKVAEGAVEIMISIRGGTLNFIDQFSQANDQTRSQVIEAFLDMAIARVANAVAEAEKAMEQGASREDVAQLLSHALQTTPQPELVEKYKEVMGIK